MKGQLSAEMLILIAVIIAVVAIAATRLISTAEKSSESIDKQTGETLNMTEAAIKGKPGDFCTANTHCASKQCDISNNACEP